MPTALLSTISKIFETFLYNNVSFFWKNSKFNLSDTSQFSFRQQGGTVDALAHSVEIGRNNFGAKNQTQYSGFSRHEKGIQNI